MHLQAIINSRTSSALWRGGQLWRLNCWGGERICNYLFQRRLPCFLRVVVNGKCIYFFRPHKFPFRVLSSYGGTNESCPPSFEEKTTFNSELSRVPLQELRTLKRHVSTIKIYTYRQRNTHTHTHSFTLLRRGGGLRCVCESSRSSSSSRVPSFDSFAVFKKPG